MRLRRVRLVDYRGVTDCEVELLPDGAASGITVVEGPNEVGKTSIAEAVALLWEYPHSSRHRDVRAVRPAGRDVGSTVVVDVDDGSVAFTYEKTWNRDAGAVLRVHRPRTEELTGKQAHARAAELLDGMVDRELWSALGVRQGHVGQPDLAGTAGLVRALGGGHGEALIDERDLRVAERVAGWRDRWRTPAGRDRRPLREAEEELARLEQEREGVAAVLEAVRRDLDEITQLETAAPGQREALTLSSRELVALSADLERVEDLRDRHADLVRQVTAAEGELGRARADAAARTELRDDVADARREAEAAAADVPDGSAEAAAAAAADAARAEVDDRAAEVVGARARADAAVAACDRVADARELVRLTDLRRRLRAASRRVARADEQLTAGPVDDAALAAVRAAAQDIAVARAELSATAPEVVIEALRELELTITDGQPRRLEPGGVHRAVLRDDVPVRLDDVAVIRLRADGATATARGRLRAAEDALADRLAALGCREIGEVEERHARTVAAERDRRTAVAERDALLAQPDAERLEEAIAACRARQRRPAAPAAPAAPGTAEPVDTVSCDAPADTPVDGGAARAAREEATAALAVAEDRLAAARVRLDAAAGHRDILREAVSRARSRHEIARAEAATLAERLVRARNAASDDALAAEVDRLEAVHREAGAAAALVAAEIAERDPESLRARVDTLRGAVSAGRERITGDEQRVAVLRAGIAARSEEGPKTRLDAVDARIARVRRDLARDRLRADAATRVEELLGRHRAEQRRRHVAPLAEEIRRLGRILWNPSFDVELDEELRIAVRHLDGRALAFEDLSLGAQEQLALILRLACAMVIGPDGAPLLIDDALGFSDPERLRRMGAVLAVAGASCQIVLLTCHPQRYLHVAGARTVRLRPGHAAGAGAAA